MPFAVEPTERGGVMGMPVQLTRVKAAMPRRRYLPAVVAEPHVIGTDESVATALQRITTHQFSVAIDALSDPGIEIGAAVSTAASSLGRIAALLRLVRSSIGADTCAAEIAILRDATALLDRLVAGSIEIRSLDEIRSRYESALRPDALADLRDQLVERHQLARLEQLPALQPGGALEDVVHQLRRARARFAAWPVDQPMHGQRPVPDSFDAFAEGLERSYRKGRKCAGKERESPMWQRHARDLAHQVELISAAWPDGMAGTVATSLDLADVLAEYAHIGALRSTLEPGPDDSRPVAVDEITAAVVESLCGHERGELMTVASVLATRLYAETPTAFVDRVARYWSTRD
ncbi:MAG: hypothetical protein R2707_19070 [Acidimicrobiales bacterium]